MEQRLIDANALDAKVEEIKWLQTSFAAALVFDAVMAIVDGLPTIDAVPVVHGVWRIVNVPKKWGGATLRCSECNTGTTYKWNYCPHCGAKMDGKEG